jgi:hypothetical protein
MATTATPATTPAQKAAATRKKNAVKRSTTAKKAAATRRENATAGHGQRAKQEIRTPIKRAGEMAPKVVLVPVGAALVARDGLANLRSQYSTRRKTENELHRFERRGTNAVKKLERDVRSAIKGIETRTEPVTKPVELVAARVENVVVSGRSAAAKVSERIASLA